jgi:tetratricopeptide (TPR) repeat protein
MNAAETEARERREQSAIIHREMVVLALLIAIAVGAFFFTRWAAGANHRRRQLDAAAWYQRGATDVAAGRVPVGVEALRVAASLDRDNRPYRLALASALTANHDDRAAGQVLSGLRAQTPDSAPINLELARIEARANREESALAYYQDALYGRWDRDQAEALRTVRVELIDYLLRLGDSRRALAELLVLSGNIPDTAADHREIGERFFQAGDARRALDDFERALKLDPKDTAALALAAIMVAKVRLDSCDIGDRALRGQANRLMSALRQPSGDVRTLIADSMRLARETESIGREACPSSELDRRWASIARQHPLQP